MSFTVPLSVGEMVEIGMIGHDGVVDSSAAPDETALNSGVVQIGGPATAIDLRTLRMLADQSRALRILLCQQKLFMFAQAQQSVACIAKHVIEERLCSKLLRSFELAENPVLPLTHEFLAQMLGVRRTSITLAVGRLDRAGLIDHRRGRIRIVDPEGLRKAACECYEAVKADMTSLLAATHLASY